MCLFLHRVFCTQKWWWLLYERVESSFSDDYLATLITIQFHFCVVVFFPHLISFIDCARLWLFMNLKNPKEFIWNVIEYCESHTAASDRISINCVCVCVCTSFCSKQTLKVQQLHQERKRLLLSSIETLFKTVGVAVAVGVVVVSKLSVRAKSLVFCYSISPFLPTFDSFFLSIRSKKLFSFSIPKISIKWKMS